MKSFSLKRSVMRLIKNVVQCFFLACKLMHVFWQIIYGAWRISKLPHPIISIFGSAQLPQKDKYAQEANQIAAWLVESDMSVLTGGGPGIMEAANCGAVVRPPAHGDVHSIG